MEEQPKGVDPTGIQAALDAASSAVTGVVDRLFQLSDSDLSAVLAQVDAICAAAAGARAAVVADLEADSFLVEVKKHKLMVPRAWRVESAWLRRGGRPRRG